MASIIKKLPLDLVILLAEYEPFGIFFYNDLDKIKWHCLIKRIFDLEYDTMLPKKDILMTYLLNCKDPKSSVGAGTFHTVFKNQEGKILAYGDNDKGQLGNELEDYHKNVEVISRGSRTIIRQQDGTIYCTGHNYHGQLGVGDNIDRTNYEKLDYLPKNIAQIVCGQHHTVIRLTDGTLMSCGNNESGQLGQGDFKKRLQFEIIKNISKNVIKIICGWDHTIIELIDGTLLGCGKNNFGYLGRLKKQKTPYFVKLDLDPIVDVAYGRNYSIMIMSDGRIMGSGCNDYGQIGYGPLPDTNHYIEISNHYIEISNLPKNIVKIACGISHSIILLTDGRLMGCGNNASGCLGLGDRQNRYKFVEIENIPKNISDVICGGWFTIIKLTDGTIMACGDNCYGHLDFKKSTKDILKFQKIIKL